MESGDLLQQLQQAWLDTQMRKMPPEHHHVPYPPSTSNGNGTSLPPSQEPCLHHIASPPSSSNSLPALPPMSNSDAVPASSIASLPPQQLQQNSDENQISFCDPVLQFINDILMEDNIKDCTCMMLECISHHATAKGFYDILSADTFSDKCGAMGDLAQHVNEDYRILEDPSTQGDDPIRVFAHEDHLFRHEGYNSAGISTQESWRASDLGGDDYGWMDALLNDVAHIPPGSDKAAAVAECPGTSSSDKSPLLSLQTHDMNSHGSDMGIDTQQDFSPPLIGTSMCYDASVHSGSTSLPLPSYNNRSETITEMSEQQCSEADSRVPGGVIPSRPNRRPVSDTPAIPANTAMHASGAGKYKRAASQVDSAVEAHQSPGSTSTLLSFKGSIGPSVNFGQEEVVSFVQNKDLNAESYASALHNGLASIVDEVCKSHPASIVEGEVSDYRTWNLGKSIDLKGLLVACAQAVAAHDIRKAHEILQKIRHHASPYGSGEERLAHYFAEGLVARLSNTGSQLYSALTNNSPSAAKMLKAHHHYVEVCPFVKVSHYFANKAILEAAKGATRLHIVDYGILYGLQWPCLISALAEREGGPPFLRITGIDFSRPGIKPAERVEMTGRRLSEYARAYGVPFEYHAVASKWETIQPSSLHLKEDEVLVVNSMFRLRHVLDETVLASNPRKTVLGKIRAMNPKIFVQGVKSASWNALFFMPRFSDALTFFSYHFDMLDATAKSNNQERQMIEREVLGRDILNIIACEGPERVERPETYKQWENRTRRAGFEQNPLNQVMLKEAQVIVRAVYNKNFSVDEDGCWMLLGWKGQTMHGLSVWKPNGYT
eukprot:c23284_g1_i1 orf=105-2597(+)